MDLKLNIYDGREISKTYTAETYDLMLGTVEDLIDIVDLDSLQSGSDVELVKLAVNALTRGMDVIKPLLKDIFEGLTDDELKHTKVKDLASVLVAVTKFAIDQISKGSNQKN